jgi:tRNA C32,U32 (ribose-2'-O)-methylase TrmJ
MKLFELIPENLFSILASKNKKVYLEALFVLRKAFKQEMVISKTDLVSMLIASLDEMILDIDFSDEDASSGEDTRYIQFGGDSSGTLSASAHFLLRRLRETGWIDVEYQVNSFEESVTLPDYSIKIINLLYSLTEEQTTEYNSHVYSAYSDLRTADQERDEYMFTALVSAYEKTMQLLDELKTLHNNIRRYHQALNEYATVNEVLKGHFDEYKSLISDRIYHPLKTLDSVPRFRTPILKILGGWMADYDLREKISEQALLRGRYRTKEEAMEGIIMLIGEITDTYERLDEMLQEIDRKNSAYTRASMEKMQYLLNSDRSIKGKIVDLLMGLAGEKEKGSTDLYEQMSKGVQLFRQGYMDSNSLYFRDTRRKKNESNPLEVRAPEEDLEDQTLQEFIDKARKSFSHQRVMNFMNEVLREKDVVNSGEIPLVGDEEFILLMLAALKGTDKKIFYRVEFFDDYNDYFDDVDNVDDDDDYIDNNGYRVPRMRFLRKEK